MTELRKIGIISILLFFTIGIYAQRDTLDFFQKSQEINNTGMLVLGTWAVSNMAVGVFGVKNNTGAEKYFHQMNVMWNTVNVSIAAYSLINGLNDNLYALNNVELLNKHQVYENLFLINAGLDVLYMGTGAFMVNRSKTLNKRQDLVKGYGQSILLQGGFLFVFDLIMYGIQHTREIRFFEHGTIELGMNAISLGVNF